MCTKSVIGFETKSVVLKVADCVCFFLSVCEFILFVCSIAVTYVFVYIHRAVSWRGECVV